MPLPAAVIPALITAGATAASTLASSLLQSDAPSSKPSKSAQPGVSVGNIGSSGRAAPLFSGRQDLATPSRSSLALELLRRG